MVCLFWQKLYFLKKAILFCIGNDQIRKSFKFFGYHAVIVIQIKSEHLMTKFLGYFAHI